MPKAIKDINEKGFTLVELMIVIAIIGILAAIAVPQFAAYRVRANNTSAEALLKNAVSAEAALNSDIAAYGISDSQRSLTTAAGQLAPFSRGVVLIGQIIAASRSQAGAHITGTSLNNVISAVGITMPDGIGLRCSVTSANGDINQGYLLLTHATGGNRGFATESDISDIIYFVQNDDWTGEDMNSVLAGGAFTALTTPPIVSATRNEFNPPGGGGVDGGGRPSNSWAVLQ